MKYKKRQIKNCILGSSLLGTGGGGKYSLASTLISKMKDPKVKIVDVDTIKKGLVATVFGVGGLKKGGKVESINLKNIRLLEKIIKQKISYLIPVEIGPVSVANAFCIAHKLSLPLIDGDIVGYRSSPEIYLETIILGKIDRTPIVASNSEGDTITIYKSESTEKVEKILRNFSKESRTKTYVAGYPTPAKIISKYIGKNSISFSNKIGKILNSEIGIVKMKNILIKIGFKFITWGNIISQSESNKDGFTSGELIIKSKKSECYRVLYKNEFIVLLKNKKPILTVPDSIIILDINKRRGINNSENNTKKEVMIFGRKSIKIWRTREGLKLFSPNRIGFNYNQKLL